MSTSISRTDVLRPELLAERTVLITGGGTGLGQAMAHRFGALGARIGICGRRAGPLQETCAALHAAGVTAA